MEVYVMKKGFTLLEIMIVILIISILLLMMVPRITSYQAEAEVTQRKMNGKNLESALQRYELEHGSLPDGTPLDTNEMTKETKEILQYELEQVGKTYQDIEKNMKVFVPKEISEFSKNRKDISNYFYIDHPTILSGKVFTKKSMTDRKGIVYSANYTNGVPYPTCGVPKDYTEVRRPKEGSGTASNPYVIRTWGELEGIRLQTSAYYELGNSLNGCVTKTMNNGKGYEPFGYIEPIKLNGKGYYIYNLFMNRPGEDFVGLFKSVKGGKIENIVFQNAQIKGGNYTAVVAGEVLNSVVQNIHINGEIEGRYYVSSLIGRSVQNDITNIVQDGSVKGELGVGGIIGEFTNGTKILSFCFMKGKVTGEQKVGGIAGYAESGKITNSGSEGEVKGSLFVGGIVGSGWIDGKQVTIMDSYVVGKQEATQNVIGGVIGEADRTTAGTYTIQNVYVNSDIVSPGIDKYPYVGIYYFAKSSIRIQSSYYNKEKMPIASYEFQKGLTENEMKQKENFVGWDFSNVWVMDGTPKIKQ